MFKINACNKLMIVAHPDDEVIFGGAQLITEFGWKIICVTNLKEPVRSKEFSLVMKKMGCEYEMWNYLDRSDIAFPQDKLDADISRVLNKRYTKIVTHNSNGEYHHLHHIQIHQTVAKFAKEFYVFGTGNCLPNEVWIKKLKLMTIYQSQKSMCKQLLVFAKHESLKKHRSIQDS